MFDDLLATKCIARVCQHQLSFLFTFYIVYEPAVKSEMDL